MLMKTNSIFKFKQFAVRHGRSSMRVGTDGVLLGAWADVSVCHGVPQANVLDIGCGCGLIALMVAQRCPSCHVLGIDIDAPSVLEAKENAAESPFADRVEFSLADIRAFGADSNAGAYSLILCNPPYYTEDTLPPEHRRSVARNSLHLSFAGLVRSVCHLLGERGIFAVVIPMAAREEFVAVAMEYDLHLRRECRVQTVSRKAPKRVLVEFGFQSNSCVTVETILLQDDAGGRSAEYSALCRDFYL